MIVVMQVWKTDVNDGIAIGQFETVDNYINDVIDNDNTTEVIKTLKGERTDILLEIYKIESNRLIKMDYDKLIKKIINLKPEEDDGTYYEHKSILKNI